MKLGSDRRQLDEGEGKLRQQWGKLTDDDLTHVNGSARARRRLQERYGYEKDGPNAKSTTGCRRRRKAEAAWSGALKIRQRAGSAQSGPAFVCSIRRVCGQRVLSVRKTTSNPYSPRRVRARAGG